MLMTCVEVDRLHPSTRQALADCCDMHRNIMRLFASSDDRLCRTDEQILYRVITQNSAVYLYITSKSFPDLNATSWIKKEHYRQQDLQRLLAGFSKGQVFSFDLLTHPSKKQKQANGNSKRVFLRTSEERAAWLSRQGEKNGFHVIGLYEEEPYDMHGKRSTGIMKLRVVRMKGQLQVVDAEKFAAAYQNGIGPEKAYGLGMLLLGGGQ